MVLLAGPGPEGGGARCLSPQPPTAPRGTETGDDPADYEEYEDFSSLADTRSIASDDSFYPPEGEDECSETGLIVACYHGFVDTVVALAECPHVDVNWQDNEGNTALITAAQAGHATITNYLLNYFPGLDLERRNAFGFTALMKAAMQGRTECVRALMLAVMLLSSFSTTVSHGIEFGNTSHISKKMTSHGGVELRFSEEAALT
uniref:ankyrin repeat domain-containing protein 33B isoform X6 n=1 Tax=Ictidomys tridecemlineatus TaxID=43179 RepID=UPI000B53A61A|nr:ankyrin repeat domain-containing protein 33B isoform X6 [Ictidomys tridecemlineatus]